MALSEKSAAVTGGDSSNQRFANQRFANQRFVNQGFAPGVMNREETDIYDFSDVVDKACEGLMNRQIKFSIRRIKEMEERLCIMEHELDAFLAARPR